MTQLSASPVVAVTGAAAGIGRAVAGRFARAGWRVALFDIDEAALNEAVRSMGEPGQVWGHRLDVADPDAWQRALEALAGWSGERLDLLVNNAGVSATQLFEDIPLGRHHRLVDINLKGVINGCHTALPWLRRTPGARVVNLCSASALHGQPMLSTYGATKAAVRSLTEALDIEWRRRHGVRVVDVLPLFVDTAMVRNDVHKMKTVSTLGVRLTAADVAEVIWRLAQRDAARLPVHTPVGWQTRLLYSLGKCSPDAVNSWITARLAGF